MMKPRLTKIRASDATKNIICEIKITGLFRYKLRLFIVKKLLWLILWISPINTVASISDDNED